VVGQPALLPGVVPRGCHVVPPRQGGCDVDRSADRSGGPGHATGGGQHIPGPHQGLAGDASPVGTLAADQLALDQDRVEAAVGQPADGHLTGRPAADHDDVGQEIVRARWPDPLGERERVDDGRAG